MAIIERENRICLLCNSGDIGDEYHYIFSCPVFDNERKSLIRHKFRHRPNVIKFKELMNSKNCSDLNNLYKLITLASQ